MTDKELIHKSLAGDKESLEELIKAHQIWLYNVAINLTGDTEDAADLMQETLIKAVTNLSNFAFKSEFRTWLYRILKNTFLNTRRKKQYTQTIPWTKFGTGLDTIKDDAKTPYEKVVVEEAKLSCMKGMLLCLTPEQRLVYVMGEMLEIPDRIGSEVMEISKANFRKKLSRARTQLYTFMNEKCGLVNKDNPCRCARKTTGFIKKGYVNPDNLQFQKNVLLQIEKVLGEKVERYNDEGQEAYRELFQSHNFQEPEDRLQSLKQFLSSDAIKKTFELNN
ncbi:MAG: RNA polymerase sigma factor [Bacteroidota bacterium]